jgi:threonyl-tRNA synthetase
MVQLLDDNKLLELRHSAAHIMAQAVLKLFPGTKLGIGPAIEDGFYYDFLLPDNKSLTQEDLLQIEKEMGKIVKSDQPFTKEVLTFEGALEMFKTQPFKLEIIRSLNNDSQTESLNRDLDLEQEIDDVTDISIYRNADSFFDLCKGPHVKSTSQVKAFKLLKVAGAYWRGNEHNQQMQRIYGTAFFAEKDLAEYLNRLEEAEKRDHRKLGNDLDLFHFPSEIGAGLVLFHPKGARVRLQLENFSRERHLKSGYEPVWTPHVSKQELFETSGHLGFYKDNMFPSMEREGSTYYLKPMSCPFHVLIYKSSLRSYKELPLRLFELATVYRFERSGVLHGLARLRALTQDDSHIFCTKEQLEQEICSIIDFMLEVLQTFGLTEFEADLSTRPDKFLGDVKDWDFVTESLESALKKSNIPYRIAEGEGAFYAPKIDIHLRDAIGRKWQLSTVQVDFQEPQKFDIEYIGKDNARHRPYMIHRALFGSTERFLAILLEHFSGALPTWLCPVQVSVLPVNSNHEDYALKIKAELSSKDISTEIRFADMPLGARIRNAKLEKIPYILVVGDSDIKNRTVGINLRGSKDPIRDIDLDRFFNIVESDIVDKLVEPKIQV